VELLSQFGPWPAVAVAANAVALLILVIGKVLRDFLTYRLVRRALKQKKARKALRDLARVIEAQQGTRRRDQHRKDKPPKSLQSGQPPVRPSGASSS
jgi:hypothetical protein